MKRRPAAATVASRPIEFLPHRFFLLVVRETPRISLSQQLGATVPTTSLPLLLPRTPGIEFLELEETVVRPRDHEKQLDAAHTIRFCRFMNATRRSHAAERPTCPPATMGRPRQIHFFVRSRVRGDEAAIVQLLIRWRLLSLRLSPADAFAPFEQLQWLFRSDFTDIIASLAGIDKGVESQLLFPRERLETDEDSEVKELSASQTFTRITKRFLLFASPIDRSVVQSTKDADKLETDRQPTRDNGDLQTTIKHPESDIPRLDVVQLAPLLKQHRVVMVVKLNVSPRYDDQPIIRSGIDHLDLSGSSDCEGIDRGVVARFLESCENTSPNGVVAVHSSTGLGRAAFCIACYLVKHSQFTAAEAIGWLRFCCPGAIPVWYASQLESMQSALWRDGDEFRKRQEEIAGSSSSPRNLRRMSLGAVDDLALSARLASQISIGKISLGRDSLLGTKDKSSRDRDSIATPPAQVAPAPRPSGGSFKDLVASDATLAKRRPLTQGALGRRRLLDHHHRSGDMGGTRDFATLHKFLHQSGGSLRTSGSVYSGSHVTALRPAATAPDRSSQVSTSRTHSKTDLTFD